MSLINEALKKAQKRQQQEAAGENPKIHPPGVPPPQVPAHGPDDDGDESIAQRFWKPALGVLAVILIGWYFFGGSKEVRDPNQPREVSASLKARRESMGVRNTTPEDELAFAADEQRRASAPRPSFGGQPSAGSATSAPPIAASPDPFALPTPSAQEEYDVFATEPSIPAPGDSSVMSAFGENDPVVEIADGATEALGYYGEVQETDDVLPVSATMQDTSPADFELPPTIASEVPTDTVIIDTSEDVPTVQIIGHATLSADPAVLSYLEQARVTGVRPSPTNPKVLLNDRVYRQGEIVDRDLLLRVTVISTQQLTFEDTRGFVYTKTLGL